MIEMLAKLLKALNSEASPAQISLALAMGMIAGLTPVMSLHNLLILFLACILRVNFSGFILSFTLFSGIAYILDPWFVQMGEALLANESLFATWTNLYQSDAWRISHFNNTLTLGSLVISLILFIPAVFIFKVLIVKYRVHIYAWVKKLKFVQILQSNQLYKTYQSLRGGKL